MAETLTGPARDLFLTIGHCQVIRDVRATGGAGCPCRRIVQLQMDRPLTAHTAEPWLGHIDRAPILFISSNPGWSGVHHGIAEGTGSDEGFIDKFVNFFDGERYSTGGIHAIGSDGIPEKRWVRYWAFARARAEELLGTDVVPGESYALTEVVHCNSRSETVGAVWEAKVECGQRYLDAVLRIAAARLIIVVGAIAAAAFRERGVSLESRFVAAAPLLGRQRAIVFLPHPNSRHPSSFGANVPAHLEELRLLARGQC